MIDPCLELSRHRLARPREAFADGVSTVSMTPGCARRGQVMSGGEGLASAPRRT
jgi:hypothetical protein